jgi:hypothetical protein
LPAVPPTPTLCPSGPSFTPDPACFYAGYQVIGQQQTLTPTPGPTIIYVTATPKPPPYNRPAATALDIPHATTQTLPSSTLDTGLFLLVVLGIPILWYSLVGGARTRKQLARFAVSVLVLLGLALLIGYLIR